jgi:NADPH-dependent curcumin reductase CurA
LTKEGLRRRTVINRRVVPRSRPVDVPTPTDFGVVEGDVPEPAPGQAIGRTLVALDGEV